MLSILSLLLFGVAVFVSARAEGFDLARFMRLRPAYLVALGFSAVVFFATLCSLRASLGGPIVDPTLPPPTLGDRILALALVVVVSVAAIASLLLAVVLVLGLVAALVFLVRNVTSPIRRLLVIIASLAGAIAFLLACSTLLDLGWNIPDVVGLVSGVFGTGLTLADRYILRRRS
jgi:hypothetical protein